MSRLGGGPCTCCSMGQGTQLFVNRSKFKSDRDGTNKHGIVPSEELAPGNKLGKCAWCSINWDWGRSLQERGGVWLMMTPNFELTQTMDHLQGYSRAPTTCIPDELEKSTPAALQLAFYWELWSETRWRRTNNKCETNQLLNGVTSLSLACFSVKKQMIRCAFMENLENLVLELLWMDHVTRVMSGKSTKIENRTVKWDSSKQVVFLEPKTTGNTILALNKLQKRVLTEIPRHKLCFFCSLGGAPF